MKSIHFRSILHATRTLIPYNDEFHNSSVRVQVQIKSGATVYASNARTYMIPLGERRDIALSFQVPAIGGQTFDLVLTTFKGATQTFAEAKRFKVRETGFRGQISTQLTLGGTS